MSGSLKSSIFSEEVPHDVIQISEKVERLILQCTIPELDESFEGKTAIFSNVRSYELLGNWIRSKTCEEITDAIR